MSAFEDLKLMVGSLEGKIRYPTTLEGRKIHLRPGGGRVTCRKTHSKTKS